MTRFIPCINEKTYVFIYIHKNKLPSRCWKEDLLAARNVTHCIKKKALFPAGLHYNLRLKNANNNLTIQICCWYLMSLQNPS